MLLVSPNERFLNLINELWNEYNLILSHEECYWYHQARSKWVSLGDQNTRFFHQSTLKRRRINRIMALLDEQDNWIYDEIHLQNHIRTYYANLYSSSI